MFVRGNDFGQALLDMRADCKQCGSSFSFEQGRDTSIAAGIAEEVVTCPKCRAVYQPELSPGRGLVLATELTPRYAAGMRHRERSQQQVALWHKRNGAIGSAIGMFVIAGFFFGTPAVFMLSLATKPLNAVQVMVVLPLIVASTLPSAAYLLYWRKLSRQLASRVMSEGELFRCVCGKPIDRAFKGTCENCKAQYATVARDQPGLLKPPLVLSLAEAREETPANNFALPQLTDRYLHKDHGPFGSRQGSGGRYFEQAKAAWNRNEYDAARQLLEQALKAELTMPYESYARSILGQIWIEKGDLGRAVDEFLQCLAVPVRQSDALWMSAVRLRLVYEEAGREKEAEMLGTLAMVANTRGMELSDDGERKIRSLVRR